MTPGISECFSTGIHFGFNCCWIYGALTMLGKVDGSWIYARDTPEKMERKRTMSYNKELEAARRGFDYELKALRANASAAGTEEDLLNQAYTNLLRKIK